MRALLAICLLTGVAAADDRPNLVGRWRVIGCETSPQDPADCGRGAIVFTKDHVTVDVGASDHKSRAYRVVKALADRLVLEIDGVESDLVIKDGEATWAPPGVGGRVGRLTFRR